MDNNKKNDVNMDGLLREVLDSRLKKLVCSNPRKKSAELRKVTIKPVMIKGSLKFQFEYLAENKATHKNMESGEAFTCITELISDNFKQINIFTAAEEITILASKPEKPHVKRKTIKSPAKGDPISGEEVAFGLSKKAGDALLSHDRKKNYIIPEDQPCDFLMRLGVMDENGKVFKKHYNKFRQINRYLEILKDVADKHLLSEDKTTLKVIDFGCGKAYLTFAVYHYLHNIKGLDLEVVGLDLKKDVIDFCNTVAKDLEYENLVFKVGDIADYKDVSCDMVMTLHACDTATDFALANAVNWNAKVILSVPCCQHELFKQIKNEELNPLLKHGLLKDRFTELLTDSLRGLALESRGYDVQMMEFTTLEHTQKNIMIRAILSRSSEDAKSKKASDEYRDLKEHFGVTPATDLIMR